MSSKFGYVYLITNLLNGKKYAGQKKSDCLVESYWGSGFYIKNAIKKYGIENFKREILGWYYTQKELDEAEINAILEYNCLCPNGYNQTLNVCKSGFRQHHSKETINKIKLTKNMRTKEQKEETSNKFKKTISKRTEEYKEKLSKKISEKVKASSFYEKIHSDEYREKQRKLTLKRFENPNEIKKLSQSSKENWKRKKYRDKCIKNLNPFDSKSGQEHAMLRDIIKRNENTFTEYNKTEKAREISRKNAEKMRERLNNMTYKEKELVKMKMKLGLLKSRCGEESSEYKKQLEKILKLDKFYDPLDSIKDRDINKKTPIIKLESKKLITFNKEFPVYDLTVDGPIPNFQLSSQVYVHNCPGGGKSRMMAYLAKHAIEEMKRVVFITLELNEEETMTNILLSTLGMSLSDLRNKENRQELIEKIARFRDTYAANLMIKFYKPSSVTANTIHNYIQKLIRTKKDKEGIDWKPDVIFLDYMDKLLPIDKVKGNIYEDNGGVADDCKNLAIDFDCPVITGSQLGRGSWNLTGDQVISMASIAESARKAHLAHSLTTINANPQEKVLGKARLYVAKSRSGTTGEMIYIDHNLGRCSFYETDPWTQEEIAGATQFTVRDTTSGNTK